MSDKTILDKIAELLGIKPDDVAQQVEKIDQSAAAAGVATKEIDPLAALTELQAQVTALTEKVNGLQASLNGVASKEVIDQAMAQGRRADDVLQQVKALFVQSGTGRKESAPVAEQAAIIEKEKKELSAPANPWATEYDYSQAGGH